jgi:Xaa-Pro aminopeptidase
LLQRFTDAFPNAVFEDVTTMMGNLRAVKTLEEIATMERACAMVETGIQRILATAKPGMPDYQVYAEYYYGIMSEGTEIPTMVLWGSGPGHPRDAFLPTHRPIQKGDMLTNELEAKYIGYNAQRVQPIVMGNPTEADLKAMEKHRAVFNSALETMKPGVKFGDFAAAIKNIAEGLDCTANVTMHGRGLGEDRPLLVGGNLNEEVQSFTLQEGNTFIVKPAVTPNGGPTAHWGDTVTVTPTGGRRLGKDPHELMSIPC